MNFSEKRFFLTAVCGIVLLDQLTKLIIQQTMIEGQSIGVLGNFLKISFIFNRNAAFGLPVQKILPFVPPTLFFGFFMLAAMVILVIMYWRTMARERWLRLALILILGGAGGNFVDRIMMGQVVDFLDVDFPDINIAPFRLLGLKFPGYVMDRWPTFNVADMSVTCGITLLLAVTLFVKQTARDAEPPEQASAPGSHG